MKKTTKVVLGLAAAAVFSVLVSAKIPSAPSASDADECTIDKISLSHLLVSSDGSDYDNITGVIHNGCSTSIGVQLNETAKYANGDVAYTDKFWPASTINIPAGSDYSFDQMERAPQDPITSSTSVESVNKW
jgi:hypothetical protein